MTAEGEHAAVTGGVAKEALGTRKSSSRDIPVFVAQGARPGEEERDAGCEEQVKVQTHT